MACTCTPWYFNPRSSCEERRTLLTTLTLFVYFNPRSSCEERHPISHLPPRLPRFQSTLLMRGATILFVLLMPRYLFQSTLLMRGATVPFWVAQYGPEFQSTLLMRGATGKMVNMSIPDGISIHAPHARSDDRPLSAFHRPYDFNPRSSCEERHPITQIVLYFSIFQSTLLMRGATPITQIVLYFSIFQSTLLMRGATYRLIIFCAVLIFQSTLLMRGATHFYSDIFSVLVISIHAPHARSDVFFKDHSWI